MKKKKSHLSCKKTIRSLKKEIKSLRDAKEALEKMLNYDLSPQESWSLLFRLTRFLRDDYLKYDPLTQQRINRFEEAMEILNDVLIREWRKD